MRPNRIEPAKATNLEGFEPMPSIDSIKLTQSELQSALSVKKLLRMIMPMIILSYLTTIILAYFATRYVAVNSIYLRDIGLSAIEIFSPPMRNLIDHLIRSNLMFPAAYVFYGALSSILFSLSSVIIASLVIKELTLDYYILMTQERQRSFFKGIAVDLIGATIGLAFAILLVTIAYNVDLSRIYQQQSYRSRGIYLVVPAIYQVVVLLFLLFLMQSKKILLVLRDERFS
jgi:hypothetical protein